MKLNSTLFILLFIAFSSHAQKDKYYFVTHSNDTIPFIQNSFMHDEGPGHELYAYKRPGGSKKEKLDAAEVKAIWWDGHLKETVSMTQDGKGPGIMSDIIAINKKYIFAMRTAFSDICDVYIIEKETGKWVEPKIKTESGKKRDAAKALVLKYFSDCPDLVNEINSSNRFPGDNLRSGKLFDCQ